MTIFLIIMGVLSALYFWGMATGDKYAPQLLYRKRPNSYNGYSDDKRIYSQYSVSEAFWFSRIPVSNVFFAMYCKNKYKGDVEYYDSLKELLGIRNKDGLENIRAEVQAAKEARISKLERELAALDRR